MNKVELSLTSKFFITVEAIINSAFIKKMPLNFQSPPQVFDFEKSIETANNINNWCANITNQYIKNVITSGKINYNNKFK